MGVSPVLALRTTDYFKKGERKDIRNQRVSRHLNQRDHKILVGYLSLRWNLAD